MSVANQMDEKLNMCIHDIAETSELYVKSPGRDFTRKRKLDLVDLTKLVLSMKGGTLNKELYEYARRSDISLTASAFVQQRSKVLPQLFEDLFHSFNDSCNDQKKYQGYRLLAVDGSDLNISRNREAETFVVSKENPKGYNQYHINVLFDLCNKVYTDCVLQPRPKFDERKALSSMLRKKQFGEKTIIIADRGYESYNMIAHMLKSENVDFLVRVKQNISAMAEIKKLPMQTLDSDIAVTITTTQTNEDKKHGRRFVQTGSRKGKQNSPGTIISTWEFGSPCTLKFRVVRFLLLTGEYETLVTSLDRRMFPIETLKELYHMRWGIETSFRDLKYSIGLVNIHAKKDELVQQDIFASLIMYNFCERITNACVVQQKQNNVHTYQVNYSMAIHICRDFYAHRDKFRISVLEEICKYILPIRPGRRDKRNPSAKKVVSFSYRVAA